MRQTVSQLVGLSLSQMIRWQLGQSVGRTDRQTDREIGRPVDSTVDSTSASQSVNHVGRKSVCLVAINLIDRQWDNESFNQSVGVLSDRQAAFCLDGDQSTGQSINLSASQTVRQSVIQSVNQTIVNYDQTDSYSQSVTVRQSVSQITS